MGRAVETGRWNRALATLPLRTNEDPSLIAIENYRDTRSLMSPQPGIQPTSLV